MDLLDTSIGSASSQTVSTVHCDTVHENCIVTISGKKNLSEEKEYAQCLVAC